MAFMDDYAQAIRAAGPGRIVPMVRPLPILDPVDFFARISDYGRSAHCCLFESKEYLASSGAISFGTARPAFYLSGKDRRFSIRALGPTGRRMLKFLAARPERFSFCRQIDFKEDEITGQIDLQRQNVDEQSRLCSVNQTSVMRAVAFAFSMASKPFRVTCGLLGAISYDFIDQFEVLPANRQDLLENPDYELYFADNIFLCDHEKGAGYAVVNCIVTDEGPEAAITDAEAAMQFYLNAGNSPMPRPRRYEGPLPEESTDTPRENYQRMVADAKDHIVEGDIFQVVLSRTKMVPCPDEPLDVYNRLRQLNPSPYMFYLNSGKTVLMGSSPELNLRVSGNGPLSVEIRPIAGTKPRGRVGGRIDPDTDFRYEAELKLDHKELAEHIMLVDLARNDVARVAQPGSRVVTELLIAEKYSSVQHLVSNVKGILADGLDALSAYVATMNMGTLTGAPKIEAMKIIRRLEECKRGYYGGAVMYLTVDGTFDSCITIRSLQVKDHVAYIRAGAGIVHDSVPACEFDETEHKARSCRQAVVGGRDDSGVKP